MTYILWTILAISLSLNILGVWYIQRLLTVYSDSMDEMVVIFEELEAFQQEIEKVYNMEVYYGDATIENMIRNISVVSEKIDVFLDKSSSAFGEEE